MFRIIRPAPGLATLTLAALLSHAAPGHAGPTGLSPDALLAQFPPPQSGFEREAPAYEPAPEYTGEVGYASARYREESGGSNAMEYEIRLKDLGARGGRMYQDYGADYLKGPVLNDTQRSLEIAGQPGLLTETSDSSMEITTFFAPGLVLSAVCMNTGEADCLAALEQVNFAALKELAASVPP